MHGVNVETILLSLQRNYIKLINTRDEQVFCIGYNNLIKS